MKNAGWLFYRDYYKSLEQEDNKQLANFVESGKLSRKDEVFFKDESNALLNFKWCNSQNSLFPTGNQQPVKLETTYPGLLVGSGYSHQTGSMGEFKLGFFFDYTTGLPIIPGSSVKGLLRSAFPGREKRSAVKNMKVKFIAEQLGIVRADLAGMDVAKLEDWIFTGKKPGSDDFLPMHQHDVFLDAFIVGTQDQKKRIFADDFITPHKDPLKNPVPVRFLKIRPEVIFQFNFILHDSTIGNLTLKANEKVLLFENILRIFGIGAKTNVGYGQFKD
ncbi:MAG: type III-B CRISPR module RAMP protein Cmr6 [Saprospiraceae bacterium]